MTDIISFNFSAADPCPSSYTEYNDAVCYKLNTQLLFKDNAAGAESKCQQKASSLQGTGNLATIKDQATSDWIQTTFSSLLAGLLSK